MNTLKTAKELLTKIEAISFDDVLGSKSIFFKELINWLSVINTNNKEFEKITHNIQENIGCILKRIGAIKALKELNYKSEENKVLDEKYENKLISHQKVLIKNIETIIYSLEQESFPRKVKCFIANNEIDIAIKLLLDYFEELGNSKAYNESILFSASHECLVGQINRNTISFENMNLERNRINIGLINIIDREIKIRI